MLNFFTPHVPDVLGELEPPELEPPELLELEELEPPELLEPQAPVVPGM